MSDTTITRARLVTAVSALVLVAGGVGFGLAKLGTSSAADQTASPAPQKKILYWYDPMIPGERHDGPGLSSMRMKLIPRYADEGAGGSAAPGVAIDPASLQRLGARIVTVERGSLCPNGRARRRSISPCAAPGMPGSRGRHESACCFSGGPPDRLHRRSGAADRKV